MLNKIHSVLRQGIIQQWYTLLFCSRLLYQTTFSLCTPHLHFCLSSDSKTEPKCSLVPRLPHSGNANIEVVQAGRAWYFSHVNTIKGREGAEKPVHGCIWNLRTWKRMQIAERVTYYTYWGVDIIHTECWTHSWLNNSQNVAFLFKKLWVLLWLCHAHMRKDSRLSPHICIHIPERGSLGTRLTQVHFQAKQADLWPLIVLTH